MWVVWPRPASPRGGGRSLMVVSCCRFSAVVRPETAAPAGGVGSPTTAKYMPPQRRKIQCGAGPPQRQPPRATPSPQGVLAPSGGAGRYPPTAGPPPAAAAPSPVASAPGIAPPPHKQALPPPVPQQHSMAGGDPKINGEAKGRLAHRRPPGVSSGRGTCRWFPFFR